MPVNRPWPDRESLSEWDLVDYRRDLCSIDGLSPERLAAVEAASKDCDELALAYAGIAWAHHETRFDLPPQPATRPSSLAHKLRGFNWQSLGLGLAIGSAMSAGLTPYSMYSLSFDYLNTHQAIAGTD